MKIKSLLVLGSFVLFGACNDSDYDLENLVPEQYHKILYVKNSGKKSLTLYDTEDDNKYTFSVVKSGSDPSLTANATITVLTQEELDNKYSTPEEVNYKLIDEGSYSLETTQLHFSSTDRYKTTDISLKPQRVKALIESDPTAVWVLPILVTSDADSINSEMNELFLRITGVISPAIGFTKTSLNLKEYQYGSVPAITEKIGISLDTDNKWDISWNLGINTQYIESYNTSNSTVFKVLPQGTYTIPASMALPNGTKSIDMEVSINGDVLQPGDYMLPIEIKDVSQFVISSDKSIHPMAIRVLGTQFDRSTWTAEANTEEPNGEGGGNGVSKCLLDGNTSTYWHSQWQGGNKSLPHEIIVDTKKEHTFTHLALKQRQHGNYTDTGAGMFYISNDKQTWTEVGVFTMQKILDTQIFGINQTKGRYIKIKITKSYRDLNCSLSEVYAYGLN